MELTVIKQYNKILRYVIAAVIVFCIILRTIDYISAFEPQKDYVAAEINNGIKQEYYFGIAANKFNDKYQSLKRLGWDKIYLSDSMPKDIKSNSFSVVDNYAYVDYMSQFTNGRVRFYQDRTGAEIGEDAALMDLCQDYEETKRMPQQQINMYGRNFTMHQLEFYHKETKEYNKTVTFLLWKEDGFSFFLETDFSLEELETFFVGLQPVEIPAENN